MPKFSGFVFSNAGEPLIGATVNLYAKNTTTSVLASTSTNASAFWEIDYSTAGEYDIEIVRGSTKKRIKHDLAMQVDELTVGALILTDFTNATHDHSNAAGGGALEPAEMETGETNTARRLHPDGAGGVQWVSDSAHTH